MNDSLESKNAILRSYLLINPIKSNRSISLNQTVQNKSIDTRIFQKKNENKKCEPLLEYKARRKLCIKVTDYPITFQGKSTLDISKTFTAPKNNSDAPPPGRERLVARGEGARDARRAPRARAAGHGLHDVRPRAQDLRAQRGERLPLLVDVQPRHRRLAPRPRVRVRPRHAPRQE